MASYSFYCRSSKENRLGYAPIELSIIINGKRSFINLPRKEKPSVFKRLMSSKQNNQLKEFISLQMTAINSAITAILSAGQPLTTESLRDYLQNGGVKLYTLSDLFSDFFKLLESRWTYENYQKYDVVRNDFISFIGDKNKPITAITNADIQAFYAHLNKQYKASTATGKMAKLKCVFRYAMDNNLMTVNVFGNIKLCKQKPNIEYLTEAEVKTIAQKDFGIDRLNKVRDLFLFQCGSGLAYADMANLKPSDVKVEEGTTYIEKSRQKTSIRFTAVLLPIAVDIIKKYDCQLPILSNQKMNAYLGEIAVLTGIEKRLHSHLARKTYATYLLNHGVNLSVVSKCLGHANTHITQSTYSFLQTSTILKSVSSISV